MRQMTPNQPYPQMQPSQVRLIGGFFSFLVPIFWNYLHMQRHNLLHIYMLSGLYHICIAHGHAAASVSRWRYSSLLLRSPELPRRSSRSQPRCGGATETDAAEAQRLRSPAGAGVSTQYAEHAQVGITPLY